MSYNLKKVKSVQGSNIPKGNGSRNAGPNNRYLYLYVN